MNETIDNEERKFAPAPEIVPPPGGPESPPVAGSEAPARVQSVIRTVIVDDSAFVRKVVREILGRSPFIEVVGSARDGEEALQLVAQLQPDVVTCDLTMPGLDGVSFVRLQMARKPLPILIFSASPQDAEQVMAALNAGAVDFVRKPTALATEELFGIRAELVEKVKAAARAPLDAIRATTRTESARPVVAPLGRRPTASRVDLVVIGISTGGPQALRQLLPRLPRDFPVPIAIVLHMPVGYTAPFAEKLAELSQLRVREARDGDRLDTGTVLLAPAGRHLLVRRNSAGDLVAHLAMQPLEKLHRPSADVLFQSAAEALRDRVLAVVMTGMGDDGKQGAAWVKAQGGAVLTESATSCVIYGMPRSVEEAGLSDASVPLSQLPEAIIEHL
jgi:two-component system chemotaxis response regulator CheB